MDTTSTTRPSGARRHTQKKDTHLGRTIAGRRHARKPTPLPLALPTTRDDSQLHRSNNQSACTHARARARPRPRSARASPGDQPQGGPPCDSPHHFFKVAMSSHFTRQTIGKARRKSQRRPHRKKARAGVNFGDRTRVSAAGRSHQNAFARARARRCGARKCCRPPRALVRVASAAPHRA